jgi:hypothetical protein
MAQFGTKRRTVRAPFSAGIAVSGRIAKMKFEFAEVMRRVLLFDRTELITWELCWVVFEIRGHTETPDVAPSIAVCQSSARL